MRLIKAEPITSAIKPIFTKTNKISPTIFTVQHYYYLHHANSQLQIGNVVSLHCYCTHTLTEDSIALMPCTCQPYIRLILIWISVLLGRWEGGFITRLGHPLKLFAPRWCRNNTSFFLELITSRAGVTKYYLRSANA